MNCCLVTGCLKQPGTSLQLWLGMGSGIGFCDVGWKPSGHRDGTGLQIYVIWACGLRWGWDVVWHPGVKQLKSIEDEEDGESTAIVEMQWWQVR